MVTEIVLILIQITGWITAYPRNKKWVMKYDMTEEDVWTNAKMLTTIFVCCFMWYFVWFFVIIDKINNWKLKKIKKGWLDKKSKF